jgi:hypothetical protein
LDSGSGEVNAAIKHTHQPEREPRGSQPERDLHIKVHFCIPDDQSPHMPKRRRAPVNLPAQAPLPRVGEFVYLSSTSGWVVTHLVHEWRSAHDLRIEIWLDHVGGARDARHPHFQMTQ